MGATEAASAGEQAREGMEGCRTPPSGVGRSMKQVVLVGAGHTHVYVLEQWRRSPIEGAELTCVSPFRYAAYSGMLPGVLAGQFERSAMEIDLQDLCATAGARLIVAAASGLDLAARQVLLDGRTPLSYDVLSLGVGSVPSLAGVRIDDASILVPVKPMQTFFERLCTVVRRYDRAKARPLRLAVVGGGAAGVEVALTAPGFLRRAFHEIDVRCILITEGGLLAGGQPATIARVGAALERHGVLVRSGSRVVGVDAGGVTLDGSSSVPCDVVVWVTGAVAPRFLHATGLPRDERGFVRTSSALQSVGGGPVFAVGDSGSIDRLRVPKAGVHAVRQGPVLWTNLRRTLKDQPLEPYVPQATFLTLINTGDESAIGEWRSWSFEGRGAAVLKSWIDRRFVGQFQALARRASAAGPVR